MFYISHSGGECLLSIYNRPVSLARYPLAAIILLSLVLLVASLWPISYHSEKGILASAPDLALTATIDLDYPEQVRLGTSAPLHLSTRLATTSSHLQPTLTIVNLNSACLNFDPIGDTIQPVNFAQAQTWVWQVTPSEALGACNVDLIVKLKVESTERLIWVRHLSLETTTVFGLPAPVAQALGLTGSILGFLALAAIQLRSNSHSLTPNP
jgi:hypothetical protein